MAEYEVTGITYQIGHGLPREKAKDVTHKFLAKLKVGTPLILSAEPSNMHDENAIAVYMDYTRQIGYIKSASCLEVKSLLDEDGQCEAIVSGNDGWITLFIEVPNAPESIASTPIRERVLPPNPLGEVLKMEFTEEERALKVVAPKLAKMKPTEANVTTMLTMAERYLPLAELSICYEDSYWRSHILDNLRNASKLDIPSDLKDALDKKRAALREIEGHQTCTIDKPKWEVMEKQLERLKQLAEDSDGLLVNFELHIATSGKSVKEEIGKLDEWFKTMPQLKMRNYQDHEEMARCLGYLRLSRKELYEVYAALILLDRYTHEQDSSSADFTDIKNYISRVKDLLAANWTPEGYYNLWDDILSLPAVKAIVRNKGKQQNTTFNRNLIAHILQTMMMKGVFARGVSNQAMAESLEGSKDHSVRTALSCVLEDRVMRAAIEKLIDNKKAA